MRFKQLVVHLVLASALVASTAMASPDRSADEQALARMSADWMTAIQNKDRNTLEAMLADDFVLQMPGDTPSQFVHRAEWLDNAIGMDWSDFRYENVVVHVRGDSATVTSRLYFKVAPNPLTFDSGIVDAWERRDGRWQVTTRYLGESELKGRMSFAFGLLVAALALAAAYLVKRISRWLRKPAS